MIVKGGEIMDGVWLPEIHDDAEANVWNVIEALHNSAAIDEEHKTEYLGILRGVRDNARELAQLADWLGNDLVLGHDNGQVTHRLYLRLGDLLDSAT